jgi:hypothetical protein
MRKTRDRGRFPVEWIVRVIRDTTLMKGVKWKVKECLARTGAGRLRTICIVLIIGMLFWDTLLLLRAGGRTRAAPHVTAIRPVTTVGVERRQPRIKTFGQVWDSMMTDEEKKRSWDSLLRVRPGLKDTITLLQRMDSAVWVK